MLAMSCALLGSDYVLAVDCDEEALHIAKENAENLAASLRKQGYAAFLSQLQADSGPLHRVRIGPQKDRDSAEQMAERLQRVGHTGQVVPHP